MPAASPSQIELRDGSFDLAKLEGSANATVHAASTQSSIQRVSTSFRAAAPQYKIVIDREKVQTLLLTTDQVFSTLASYLGSSYVDQFNKFGRVFQIYVQGDAQFRMSPDDILHLKVRNQNGDMIPLGTVLTITPTVGPSLISLYNLYPSATIVGVPARGFSSGDAIKLMEEITARALPTRRRLLLDGAVVPGETCRRANLLRVRPSDASRVSRARRSV